MNSTEEKKLVKKQFYQNIESWRKSSLNGFCVDEFDRSIPWFTFDSIAFLKKFLQKKHRVCEYGCGSSTLFFCQFVDFQVGVETDKIWLNIVEEKILQQNFNIDSAFHLSNSSDSSKLSNNVHKKFFNGCKQINLYLNHDAIKDDNYQSFCNNFTEKFDVIIIDSKKRFACAKEAVSALAQDGIIILDDSQRDNYQKIFLFMELNNFKKIDFIGIAPGQLTLKNTTIFYK